MHIYSKKWQVNIPLDTLQISYFLKVAETEHMTNAAKELHISQPALSRSLRLLEEELGLKLFDRVGRHLLLNDNGRRFYAAAIQFAQGVEDLCLSAWRNPEVDGTLSILMGVENLRVMQTITDFCMRYPNIHIREESLGPTITDTPADTSHDFTLKAFNPLFAPVQPGWVELCDEPYMLAVHSDTPLARKHLVSLADAKDIPFVLPLPSHRLHGMITAYCREAGFRPICRMETNHYHIAYAMVERGECVALIPRDAPHVADCPHVHLLPLRDLRFRRTICLQQNAAAKETSAATLFVDFLLKQLREPYESKILETL